MHLLLDTHVLLWTLLEPARLRSEVIALIASPSNQVSASAASLWEIAIKQSLGKLELPGHAEVWLPMACQRVGIALMPISPADALAVRKLPWHHRDPFDRVLVAQVSAGLTLVTHDEALRPYGVATVWT